MRTLSYLLPVVLIAGVDDPVALGPANEREEPRAGCERVLGRQGTLRTLDGRDVPFVFRAKAFCDDTGNVIRDPFAHEVLDILAKGNATISEDAEDDLAAEGIEERWLRAAAAYNHGLERDGSAPSRSPRMRLTPSLITSSGASRW